MSSATLLLAGGVSVVVGASFVLVARRIASRAVSVENAGALRAQVTWWAGLGAYLLIQGAFTAAAAQGVAVASAYAVSRMVAIPVLCAAVWGLMTFLLHLYGGGARAPWFLAAAYAGVTIFFLYATFADGVPPLRYARWNIGYDDGSPLIQAVYLLVGVPVILASIAYLALVRRVADPGQRYRIVLTGASILSYVGLGLAARLASTDLLPFLTLVPLGALAASAALLAYYPPRWVRLRFEPAAQDGDAVVEAARELARRDAALRDAELAYRLRELV